MKNLLTLNAILLTMALGLFSCSKSATTAPVVPTPTTGSFTWTENGGAIITADSAFWTTGPWGTGIRAYKGVFPANFFEINWDKPEVFYGSGVKVTLYMKHYDDHCSFCTTMPE